MFAPGPGGKEIETFTIDYMNAKWRLPHELLVQRVTPVQRASTGLRVVIFQPGSGCGFAAECQER